MQDKNMVINELKKLILVTKGKSVETQFDKPSVVRQPNAQRIPKPSVLGKPTPFSNSPEMRSFQTKQSVNKTNVSDGLFKPVTQQNLPQKRNQAVRNTNVVKPGMYRIASTTTQTRTPQLPLASRNTNPHMSKSSGVIHTTSVSRPQLKSYQVKEKVVPNISQVKFTKKVVEDHHRISSISKKTKSVTACNDSSNSRTSNVNAVCAECGKCVFNSNHDACKFLGTVRFGNDQFAPILGYGDMIQGNCHRSTGNLLPSPTQAWLWHRRLSHLNFDYITLLSKKEVVTGLPKLKYVKDQLCSSCEMSKAKRSSFKDQAVPSSKSFILRNKVRGNPSMPVQTRRQLATDPELMIIKSKVVMELLSKKRIARSKTALKIAETKTRLLLKIPQSPKGPLIMPDALILGNSTSGGIQFLGIKLSRRVEVNSNTHSRALTPPVSSEGGNPLLRVGFSSCQKDWYEYVCSAGLEVKTVGDGIPLYSHSSMLNSSKTYILKAQDLKTMPSANSDLKLSKIYAKVFHEHVGQKTKDRKMAKTIKDMTKGLKVKIAKA
ncbi:retrovirus-related pol polyprotein from transposon TNT 1-94 [Tanacetum coccineum]|uniref:Retrovirus-related pol polyprotein from transposon TNT 1-94 n=1 Tax=Tanacetum coccineum TaxID=301880 RepID=A0ABQ5F756_9ASTR